MSLTSCRYSPRPPSLKVWLRHNATASLLSHALHCNYPLRFAELGGSVHILGVLYEKILCSNLLQS
jgi:hypothetical protein